MNKKLVRRSFAMLFCIIFCLSCTITAYAEEMTVREMVTDDDSNLPASVDNPESDAPVPLENSSAYHLEEMISSGLSPIETEGTINIDYIDLNQAATDSISFANEIESAQTMSANTPPVAGLSYLIANPESLLNGSITTDTIIYWLWEDEEQQYTYDPDGDTISQILTDGINEFIIGNVTLNDVVIGFATQITVAGEYQFLYQVVDEYGAASNILQYNIEVEPADGNQRPVCITTASSKNPVTDQYVAIDWSGSADPDGDALLNVRVKIYDTVGNYQYVTASSPYYAGMTDSGIILKFPQAGSYSVWTSLSDDKNAWSNWSIENLNVTEKVTYQFKDVKLISDDPSNRYPTHFTWCNYAFSIDYSSYMGNAQEIYDKVTQNTIPTEIKGRTILSTDWKISGYIVSDNDIPLANTAVKITIPLFGGNQDFNTTVYTTSSGYFSYKCTDESWYAGWNAYRSPDGGMSGVATQWARYGNYYTTDWIGASTLYVTSNAVSTPVSYPVGATTGSILLKILAHKWIYITPPGMDHRVWVDI